MKLWQLAPSTEADPILPEVRLLGSRMDSMNSGRFLHEPPRPVDEIAFFVDLKKFSIDF
jgi:hypothetical protein